ncbi:TIR domain-containing protein [Verrucosispora sp. WMMD1129]|uniref:TIR domain-containing protein n=1 Tax=Verrucosispora sp. WMMD1129 TaxID=3016093 RepID=UPI00249AE517|nr:TIR domain-containing protein [Verrucosispora sp. WMMD1129]WFE47090.1 TIR domain-containing protein [Verrucosispora sp. WMMD1129]
MATYGEMRLTRIAEAAARKSNDPTRRKCFISYHHADQAEVEEFVESFGHLFIARIIGVSDEDDFIDSKDTDYVMDCIRERYLTDSTVTIVLVGKCTWARRYVDWEIYSTLRNNKNDRRSGLMGITLPSVAGTSVTLPPRLSDNVDGDKLYARWWKYPSSDSALRTCIEDAYAARTARAHLVDNSRVRKINSSPC